MYIFSPFSHTSCHQILLDIRCVQKCWNDTCHSLQSHLAGRGMDAWREVKARVVGNLVKPKSAQLRHGKSSQTKKVCNLKKWRGNWRGGKLKRCWWENCGKVLPSGTCRRHLRLNRELWKKFDKVLICCLGPLHALALTLAMWDLW